MAGLVKSGEACSKDAFSDKAWFTATELDCQLNRVHSALFLLATRFQQAAKVQHSSWQRQHSAAWPPSDVANASTPEAAARVCELRGAPRTGPTDWCSLQACPSTCGRCRGQRHAVADGDRHLLALPQPFRPSGATAYDGEPGSEVGHFDVEKINRGLWFATVLGNLENFSETEEVYFSKGVHSRLRYVGNDPAIYMELGAQDGASSDMCTGAPNANLINSGNRGYFASGRPIDDVGQVGSFWQPPDRHLPAVASRLVLDHANMPMGTLQVDVNMSMLATRFLAQPGAAYAAVVDASGRVLALAGPAWGRLFGRTCGGRTTAEELQDCSLDPAPAGLTLADAERQGGAELGGLLERMFDGSSDCSAGMREGRIHFPTAPAEAAEQADRWHLVSFCALSSVPRWGVIVAARPQDVLEAAKFSVLPAGPDPDVETEVAGSRVRATVRVTAEQGAAPEAKVLRFLLRNVGRVALPWLAQLPEHASGNSFGLELLTEPNASLPPGGEARLDFRLSFGNTSPGLHSEDVILKANAEEVHGVCFKHPVLIHIKVVYILPKPWLRNALKKHGLKLFSAFCAVCLLVCIVPVLWYLRKEFRRKVKEEHSQSMKIDEALQCLDSVSFPMVLLAAASFKRLGALVSHEELLRRHEDLWLHTVEDVKAFSKEKHIIFVSHQWTAFASPDPTNIQYEAMVMSIETLRAQEGWEEEEMYIWVDYSCIPQRHRGTQTLAINSLMVYASNVAAFVVVAPPVKHADLGEVCDKATYQCRAWCRAEQLSHLLALGPSRMYLAEGSALARLGDVHNWLEQAKFVFQGNLTCCRREHEGMAKCDKELLVTPMLGLWAQLCQACEGQPSGDLIAIRDGIARRLDEIFPRTFLFARKGMPPEERPLFANLLDQLPLAADGAEWT